MDNSKGKSELSNTITILPTEQQHQQQQQQQHDLTHSSHSFSNASMDDRIHNGDIELRVMGTGAEGATTTNPSSLRSSGCIPPNKSSNNLFELSPTAINPFVTEELIIQHQNEIRMSKSTSTTNFKKSIGYGIGDHHSSSGGGGEDSEPNSLHSSRSSIHLPTIGGDEHHHHHHHLDEQETQIPLYFSIAKEKQRRKGIRRKIKNRLKKQQQQQSSSTPASSSTSTTSPGSTLESVSPQSPSNDDNSHTIIQIKSPKIKEVSNKKKSKDLVDKTDLTNSHLLTLEELASKFNTSINFLDTKISTGITSEEAKVRLERDGPNALTPTKPIPKWVKFFKQFLSLFPLMLEIGGILSFIAYGIDKKSGNDNLYLGIILWVVVIFTSVFTFLQESKSAHVMEGFKKMAPTSSKVVRDGRLGEINSEHLVIGDVVHIKAGDKLPADIRILSAHHFKVDNSSLTGESEPQSRSVDSTDANPLETHNLAFYSTLAVEGDCVGLVVATGDQTVIGKIAKLATKTKPASTPLKREIEVFIRIITIVSITLGLVLLTIGFATKVKWINVIVYCISVIVAQVPEGLLPTITVALTLTAKRMSKKNVLVKNLLAVETFGSTRTICSDKTGTLTQNIMTVVHLWYDDSIYTCNQTSASNYFNSESKTFKMLYHIAALCSRTVFDRSVSDAEYENIPIQQRKTIGDASESALLKFCEHLDNVQKYRLQYPKLYEVPFNSVNKWQISIHLDEVSDSLFLLIKGAPERILKKSSRIMIEGEFVDFDQKYQDHFQDAYELLASKGERALGMAMLPLNPAIYHRDYQFDLEEKNFPMEGFVFVGLVTLMDPPRPSVPEAIASCKRAGIRTMMVTGDHPLTATSIAKQIGIIEGETLNEIAKRENVDVLDLDFNRADSIVITGAKLDELNSEQWDKILAKQQVVFARTSPEQKLLIVENCQTRCQDIVAVTGDGVNDSPALKKADLGCAMGITGSEVAKEAAAIVLLDDNFSSIVSGIEEGRMIFDKLKKSICYTLSSNVPELLPFVLFFILKLPTALSGILILCIDLGTDLIPVISYAYEYSETDIMNKKPRNIKKDKLVSIKLAIFSYLWLGSVQCAAGFLNYFMIFRDYGLSPTDIYNTSSDYFMVEDANDFHGYSYSEQHHILREAQTAYFIAVIITRIGAALCCKTRKLSLFQHGFKNMVFNMGILSMISVALIIVHVPGIQTFFGTSIVSYKFWLYPIPFAAFLLIMNEIRLYLIRNYPNTWVEDYLYW